MVSYGQHTSEPLPFAALEEIPLSVSPSLTLTSTVPLSAHSSYFQMHGEPLFTFGHWQTITNPEPVAEFAMATTTHTPDVLLTAPLS